MLKSNLWQSISTIESLSWNMKTGDLWTGLEIMKTTIELKEVEVEAIKVKEVSEIEVWVEKSLEHLSLNMMDLADPLSPILKTSEKMETIMLRKCWQIRSISTSNLGSKSIDIVTKSINWESEMNKTASRSSNTKMRMLTWSSKYSSFKKNLINQPTISTNNSTTTKIQPIWWLLKKKRKELLSLSKKYIA